MNDKVQDIGEARARREKPATAIALGTLPDMTANWPAGPFTVTIASPEGILSEVVFPDADGVLPPEAPIRSTAGIPYFDGLLANLLGGAIRVLIGVKGIK